MLLDGVYGFTFEDESEQMFSDILDNHAAEAKALMERLLRQTQTDENGCKTFGCKEPRKVRFKGYRIKAYRFILCVREDERPSRDMVVRHRCANRLCVNPDHLELGTQLDNWLDHLDHSSNGIDFDLL